MVLHLKLCAESVQELLPHFEESHSFVGRLGRGRAEIRGCFYSASAPTLQVCLELVTSC